MQDTRTIACPICKTPVRIAPRPASFPFCTMQCKNIDLGRWMDDRYAIDMANGKLSIIDPETAVEIDGDDGDDTYH